MAMLSAQAANLDQGGMDGDAVRDALSLLQEASNPVITSNSLSAASGIQVMSGISMMPSSTPSSIQPRVILTGREGRGEYDNTRMSRRYWSCHELTLVRHADIVYDQTYSVILTSDIHYLPTPALVMIQTKTPIR